MCRKQMRLSADVLSYNPILPGQHGGKDLWASALESSTCGAWGEPLLLCGLQCLLLIQVVRVTRCSVNFLDVLLPVFHLLRPPRQSVCACGVCVHAHVVCMCVCVRACDVCVYAGTYMLWCTCGSLRQPKVSLPSLLLV